MNFACKRIKLEEMLDCSLGLNKTGYKIFLVLMRRNEPISIRQIASDLKLSISSVQKAILPLISKGIVKRKQVNNRKGGYFYLYSLIDKDFIKNTLKSRIMSWTDSIIHEIDRL